MPSSDPGPDAGHCPACRRALPADARFCPACGTPRATDPGRGAARRIVTVLFCDLVGSTALSGTLDPETLRTVTLRYFDAMRRRIEEHGGTLEKFIGDAVMAVFGVPAAREDDARRALAAALGMLEALRALNTELDATLGIRLDVRIGVNTGRVVTGSDTSVRQALVSGEVVNVAARLEQNAPTGQILIGPDTLRAAGPGVRTTRVGPLRLKGKTQAVTAHRLLGLDAAEPEQQRRFDLPFVGRHSELAALDTEFADVTTQHTARLLVVGGEPGQGKTRLLRHWLDRARIRRFGAGRCRPPGEQAGLRPLADAVTALLATAGDTPHPPGLDVLTHGLLADGTPTPSLEDTCAALADTLTALSRPRPAVLVIDDGHWAAPLLLDVLDRLLPALTGAAVLTVLLGRPELLDARPARTHRALTLGALTDGQARRLARSLAAAPAPPEAVPAHLLERAGGNPLHLEQLLATRPGPGTDTVPLTLQTLIGARLDALETAERRAVDLACVLGRDFTAGELHTLDQPAPDPDSDPDPDVRGADVRDLDAALRRLGRHRLVIPDTAPDTAPGTAPAGRTFRFASGVVQEVAYECLSKQDRAERHERAARLPSVLAGGPAAVGGHLERAHRHHTELGRHGPRTDDLRREAATALAEAGARAVARADPGWAVDLLTRANALHHPHEAARVPAARRLGEALLALGRIEPGRTLLTEVAATATDPVEAAHARLSLAALGQEQPPAPVARDTLPVFEHAGDDLGQARACLRLAQQEQTDGQHAAAERLLARALRHAVRAGGEQERASALGAIGVSLWRGPVPVADAVARCRALLADHHRPAAQITLNCPLAVLLALHDDDTGATACLARATRHAERLGYAEAAAFLPLFTATVAALAGRRLQAQQLLAQATAAARDLGGGALLSGALLDTARLHLDLGQWQAGEEALAALEQEHARTGDPARHASAARAEQDGLRARIAAARGDRDGALRLARGAVTAAARSDSPVLQGLASLDHARTARLLGRPEECARAAATAAARFAAKGHRPGLRLAAALGGHHPRREATTR